MKVRLSAVARHDLFEIGDYIASDNRPAARRYVAGLKARCQALAKFPKQCPACSELGANIRRGSFRSHDIYYSISDGVVIIERIIHSMRDNQQITFPRS